MTIPFKEWQKLDLRVAKILEVKPHPNADKLYLLEIDLGSEKRTLVAGLKNNYSPEDLKGKLCVVFTNLEPATIRGVKSEGMILAAVNKDESKIFILQPEQYIELGSRIS
ncbi:MAG: methionine--tRNA ligase subunit beta [archaeon]|nr:MAG: methionine--tRNA ligase subunit beta [archaeon]